MDFFAAGLVGGLVGSSIRAAMTAASKGVLLGEVAVPRGGGWLGWRRVLGGLGAGHGVAWVYSSGILETVRRARLGSGVF